MTSDDLTCRELVELVTEYLEGAMPPTDRARFEAHVRECEGCAAYLDQVRQTIRLVGRLSEESLLPSTCDELLVHFREWTRARETP